MCGFGIKIGSKVSTEVLVNIARKVNYRGPDETKTISKKISNNISVSAFFNRLAIQDLSDAAGQPFQDEENILIFNGEIYNFKELRAQLAKHDIKFRTDGDTEVVFNLLKLFGEKALRKLNGMFSIFWYDKLSNKAILSRDIFGVKPLYYYHDKSNFICASECDSISALLGESLEISMTGVCLYRSLQYVSSFHNIYNNVEVVHPGEVVEVNCNDLSISKKKLMSWSDHCLNPTDGALHLEELEEKLKTSVASQLVADVDVGMLLSSGIDSSLLLAIINTFDLSADIDICCVGSLGNSEEISSARKFVKGFDNPKFKFHALELNRDDVKKEFHSLYDTVDLPCGDNAIILNSCMYAKIKSYSSVVLGGDGADEIFSGYDRYSLFSDPSFSFRPSFRFFTEIFRRINYRSGFIRGLPEDWIRYIAMLTPDIENFQILVDTLKPSIQGKVEDQLLENIPQFMDLMTYLPDAMLFKVDRSSMKYSVEARVPYLDMELSKYGLHLSMGDRQIKQKIYLRKLLRRLAPHYQNLETKKGLNFDVSKFLQGDIKRTYETYCNEFPVEKLGLDKRKLLKNFDKFYKGDMRYTYRNWIDLNLLHWAASKLAV